MLRVLFSDLWDAVRLFFFFILCCIFQNLTTNSQIKGGSRGDCHMLTVQTEKEGREGAEGKEGGAEVQRPGPPGSRGCPLPEETNRKAENGTAGRTDLPAG